MQYIDNYIEFHTAEGSYSSLTVSPKKEKLAFKTIFHGGVAIGHSVRYIASVLSTEIRFGIVYQEVVHIASHWKEVHGISLTLAVQSKIENAAKLLINCIYYSLNLCE